MKSVRAHKNNSIPINEDQMGGYAGVILFRGRASSDWTARQIEA